MLWGGGFTLLLSLLEPLYLTLQPSLEEMPQLSGLLGQAQPQRFSPSSQGPAPDLGAEDESNTHRGFNQLRFMPGHTLPSPPANFFSHSPTSLGSRLQDPAAFCSPTLYFHPLGSRLSYKWKGLDSHRCTFRAV